MTRRRVTALIAAALLGLLATTYDVPSGQAAPPGARDVIVQLFQWNHRSVAAECRDRAAFASMVQACHAAGVKV